MANIKQYAVWAAEADKPRLTMLFLISFSFVNRKCHDSVRSVGLRSCFWCFCLFCSYGFWFCIQLVLSCLLLWSVSACVFDNFGIFIVLICYVLVQWSVSCLPVSHPACPFVFFALISWCVAPSASIFTLCSVQSFLDYHLELSVLARALFTLFWIYLLCFGLCFLFWIATSVSTSANCSR